MTHPPQPVRTVLCACLAAVALTAAAPGAGAPDRLIRLDGRLTEADVASIDADGRVHLAKDDTAVDLDALRRIDRPSVKRAETKPDACDVFLTGGGRLRAAAVTFDGKVFAVDWAHGKGLRLPLETVRAVRLGTLPAKEKPAGPPAFASARQKAETARDELFAVVDGRIQVVRGALLAVEPDGVRFVWNDKERRVAADKVYGIVLARRGPALDRTGRCLIDLADGSSVWMAVRGLEGGRLSGDLAGGGQLAVPWDAVARLRVRSTRMAFLSDLDPVEVREEALVTYAGPWRRDRSVTGGPLTLGGRVYEKGLGVHSRCRLVYDLGGRYDVFAATIGIDAGAAGRGDCVFRVEADGKERFKRRVRGEDPPHVVRLAIPGARRLALEVTWGEDLDLADRADWCDARVLKDDTN